MKRFAVIAATALLLAACDVEKTGDDTYKVEVPTESAERATETAAAATETALENAAEKTETALREGAQQTGTALEKAGQELKEHSKPGNQD